MPVLRCQADHPAAAGRLDELARRLGLPAHDALIERLETFLSDLAIPGFPSLDVPDSEWRWVAERAVTNGSNASNRRPMGVEEYLSILEDA